MNAAIPKVYLNIFVCRSGKAEEADISPDGWQSVDDEIVHVS